MMSAANGMAAKWTDHASDWFNPILIKETRQAMKSRQFVMTFMLLLLAVWLISLLFILQAGDSLEFGTGGRTLFLSYYTALSTAIFVAVPFGAYRSLLSEREQNTYELLSITALQPRQIVWGKLLSAFIQVLIFYSAIAPFIAFTSLLQGFDLAQVVMVLTLSLFASLFLSLVALLMATSSRQKHWQTFMTLLVISGLGVLLIAVYGFVSFWISDPIPLDSPNFWWWLGCISVAVGTYFILCLQLTTAQLTFESDNRSTGIRLTCSLQFWLLWIGTAVYYYFNGGFVSIASSQIYVLLVLSTLHLAILGTFITVETDDLSHRLQRDLSKHAIVRTVMVPLLPGGHRGMLYVLLHATCLPALAFFMARISGYTSARVLQQEFLPFAAACNCYLVIYLSVAALVGRCLKRFSSAIQPAHLRVIILILFALGTLFPYLLRALGIIDWRDGYSLAYITNPFETLDYIADANNPVPTALVVLGVTAAILVAFNARWLWHGIREVVFREDPTELTIDEKLLAVESAAT